MLVSFFILLLVVFCDCPAKEFIVNDVVDNVNTSSIDETRLLALKKGIRYILYNSVYDGEGNILQMGEYIDALKDKDLMNFVSKYSILEESYEGDQYNYIIVYDVSEDFLSNFFRDKVDGVDFYLKNKVEIFFRNSGIMCDNIEEALSVKDSSKFKNYILHRVGGESVDNWNAVPDKCHDFKLNKGVDRQLFVDFRPISNGFCAIEFIDCTFFGEIRKNEKVIYDSCLSVEDSVGVFIKFLDCLDGLYYFQNENGEELIKYVLIRQDMMGVREKILDLFSKMQIEYIVRLLSNDAIVLEISNIDELLNEKSLFEKMDVDFIHKGGYLVFSKLK